MTEAAGQALVGVETAEVERLEREAPDPPVGPAVQRLSADGAMVPLVGGEWAEAKTLVIGAVDQTLGGDGLPEPHAKELSYFSRLTEARSFGRLALIETHRRGTERAGVVCAVMDGAEWLQTFVDLHRPDAVRILDLPHAVQHLSAAAQAVFGPGTELASEWLGTQAHQLKHGDPGRVLAAVRALPAARSPNPSEAAVTRDRVVGYLERRAQLRYAQFRSQGYPIGSGIAESANKLVVQARLKGSEMHWARTNVDPMLALRAAACSDRWDEAWAQLCRHWRRQVAERRRACQVSHTPPKPVPSTVWQPTTAAPRQPPPARSHGSRERLVVNGRPTAQHPWRKPFLRPKAPPQSAKIEGHPFRACSTCRRASGSGRKAARRVGGRSSYRHGAHAAPRS